MTPTKKVFELTYKSSELYELWFIHQQFPEMGVSWFAQKHGVTPHEIRKLLKLGEIVFNQPPESWSRSNVNQLRRYMAPRNLSFVNCRAFGTRHSSFAKVFLMPLENELVRGVGLKPVRLYTVGSNVIVDDRDIARFEKWIPKYTTIPG